MINYKLLRTREALISAMRRSRSFRVSPGGNCSIRCWCYVQSSVSKNLRCVRPGYPVTYCFGCETVADALEVMVRCHGYEKPDAAQLLANDLGFGVDDVPLSE